MLMAVAPPSEMSVFVSVVVFVSVTDGVRVRVASGRMGATGAGGVSASGGGETTNVMLLHGFVVPAFGVVAQRI